MKLLRGMNLGGYLSQCMHHHGHYRTFIQEADIKQIADWGFDHVRLPIDYNVIEDGVGNEKPEGYGYIDQLLEWCNTYDLDLILDLHKAYGYDFNHAGDEEKNNLFSDEPLKQRFIKLWETIATRYGNNDRVAFELLNEVVEQENATLWNELITRTVTAIRAITKTVPIIYGGIQWNSASTLKLLDKPVDDNIIYTFHFYEPLVFTHQKAYWVPTIDPKKDIAYPESMDYYRRESEPIGYQGEAAVKAKATTMGMEFLQEMIQDAIDAAAKVGVRLYCGEFGVIDRAPVEDTLRWFEDVNKLFREYNIGFGLWTYKEKDFGLLSSHYAPIRDQLIKMWNS